MRPKQFDTLFNVRCDKAIKKQAEINLAKKNIILSDYIREQLEKAAKGKI